MIAKATISIMGSRIVPHKLVELIRKLEGGTVFSICFCKRTTGKERTMICQVRRGSLCEIQRWADRGLMVVWDMHKQQYRTVPLDSIKWIKIHGRIYRWVRD